MSGETNQNQSQGAKLAEISGLLSGVQERHLPAERHGQSVDIPISSRAPTTRQSEGREVGQVRRPPAVDLTKVRLEDLKEGQLSALAVSVSQMQPIPEPPQELIQQYRAVQNRVNEIQQAFNSVDWDAVAASDPGAAVWHQQQLAHALSELRPQREWCAAFEQEYQLAVEHNKNLSEALHLMLTFPFVASKSHFADAVRWFKRQTGASDAEIANASNAQFFEGCRLYQEHMDKQAKRLPNSLDEQVVGEAVSIEARRLKKKNGGRPLSKEQTSALVSQLLSGRV